MADHLAERTAFHVQLQAIVLSLNVLQSERIVQVTRACSCMGDHQAEHTANHDRQQCLETAYGFFLSLPH